jgi:hypothetical protein
MNSGHLAAGVHPENQRDFVLVDQFLAKATPIFGGVVCIDVPKQRAVEFD